jgi:hypothetical protein
MHDSNGGNRSDAPAGKPDGISRRDFLTGAAATAAALLIDKPAQAGQAPQRVFRIHPAIGVARVGNAPSKSFFIGPEVPGQGPSELNGAPVALYKQAGQVRPQAARFRVYEYADLGNGLQPIGEVQIGTNGVKDIVWTVHVANRKAAFHQFAGPAGEEYDPVDGRPAQPSAPLRNAAVTDRASLQTDFGPRSLSAKAFNSGKAPTQTFDANSAPAGYPATWPVDSKTGGPVVPYLGELQVDAHGRLLVIGGKGAATWQTATQPDLPTYANNEGWFDDIADGPVTATVVLNNGSVNTDRATGSAWVLGAPPKFSPRVYSGVTLYDLLLDLAVRKMTLPVTAFYNAGGPLARLPEFQADYTPGAQSEFPTTFPYFIDDVLPILDRAYNYRWVTELVDQKHDSMNIMLAANGTLMDPSSAGAKDRSGVFIYIRPPQGAGLTTNGTPGASSMPHLQGDDPYVGTSQASDSIRKQTLTHLQYGFLQQWARPQNGFDPGEAPGPTNDPLNQLLWQVHGLDRAALEQGSGAAFFPGIEASWQIRNWRLYSEPFRINLNATSRYLDTNGLPEGTPIVAGHFSRQMAVPWHADFNDCRSEGDWGWWPSQRPTGVFADTSTQQLSARVDWTRASPGLNYTNAQRRTSHADMVQYWSMYGFIVEQNGMFAEQERNPGIGS